MISRGSSGFARTGASESTALPAEAEQTFTQQLLEKFRPEQPVRAIFPAPAPRG
jgi:hypothetical protein